MTQMNQIVKPPTTAIMPNNAIIPFRIGVPNLSMYSLVATRNKLNAKLIPPNQELIPLSLSNACAASAGSVLSEAMSKPASWEINATNMRNAPSKVKCVPRYIKPLDSLRLRAQDVNPTVNTSINIMATIRMGIIHCQSSFDAAHANDPAVLLSPPCKIWLTVKRIKDLRKIYGNLDLGRARYGIVS